MANFTLVYDSELKKSKWIGSPDSNYSFEGDRLSYERMVKDENDKDVLVKTYKDPIEITAGFEVGTKVYGVAGNIEKNASKKFGGVLKGFIWLDNVVGGGEVVLPFTAPHIFQATGDRLNPTLAEIGTNPADDNYYEIIDSKTHVHVKSFSGLGGAAGSPPTLIAHYKMNDNLATDVILDETGNHNGAVKDATGTATSAFHSVAGKINLAQDQDGTDDYIEIPDHADFTPALTPFSISAWVYMHDATNFTIIGKYSIVEREWLFVLGSDDRIYFTCYDESANAYIGRYRTTVLTSYENQWVNLIGTYDGGILSSGIKIYLNAVQVDTTDNESGTFVAIENLGHAVQIGNYSTNYANGVIDNVQLFSVELNQDNVNDLYNGGHGTENLADLDESRRIVRR